MGAFAAAELRQLIERAERVKEEIKAAQEDLKDVFDEAKNRGYDTAAMKDVIKLRAMETNTRNERIAIVSLYAEACGLDMTPLEQAIHSIENSEAAMTISTGGKTVYENKKAREKAAAH